ncbi:MAG: glycosyltransferase, partial [Kiritimatiellae bacterium]|nr:glycosyltransferase [Kiritimatiellia bacterium]
SPAIFLDHPKAKTIMAKLFDPAFRNIEIARNDFDVPYRQPFEWPFEQPETFDLGYFGRLERTHKGFDMLLDVLAMEKWKARPLRVLAYGEGPDRSWAEAFLAEHEVTAFILKGHTNNMEAALKGVQGLVMPSRFEGTPIALVDALLCHRMAIITPVGGMPEFVQDGINGFVATDATKEAINDCLERAWQRRREWKQLGLKAGESVRRLLPEHPHMQYIETLSKVLTGNRSAP